MIRESIGILGALLTVGLVLYGEPVPAVIALTLGAVVWWGLTDPHIL